jgi:phenylalanyl-tRNA synthetase beta chain
VKIPVSWVKDFVELEVSPEQLADDLTSVGLACDGIEKFGAEAVLDLDITTNRVDAMNMYGVAREAATFYALPLKPLDLSFRESGAPSSDSLRVLIEAPELCPRFAARVFDVRVGPSPAWLKDRLELAGQRSISNIVDLSNYVMLEMGQPTHAFDLTRIRGGVLKARMARPGEMVRTLDDVERTLTSSMGVVGDAEGALALAGIMGGASSEIGSETTTVALEAAYWNPLLIRRAAKALGMRTDASHRFERGADPAGGPLSIARFASLATKGGMGTARPTLILARGAEVHERRLTLNLGSIDARLGASVPPAEAKATLTRLGFELEEPDPGAAAHLGTARTWEVLVPTWRGDCTREVDLIEEVGRHHGLMKIARTVPASRRAAGLTPAQRTERQLKALLSGLGYREVLHVNFVSSAKCDPSQGAIVRIANPLSGDQDALRTSLVMPGLLQSLERNQRHGDRDIQFFETGRTFSPSPDGPIETPRLALLASGATPRGWAGKSRVLDFFDLKRALEEILARHSDAAATWSREGAPPFLHPGRSAVLWLDGRMCGYLGEVHPDTLEAFSLKDRPVVAEIAVDALKLRALAFTAFSRFPEVARDLSILAPPTADATEITALARAQAGPAARRVELIDRFEGAGVPEGQVSLTLSFVFQDEARTLSSEEVERAMDAVRASFSKAGYAVRGVGPS